jgi:hypothetical protein
MAAPDLAPLPPDLDLPDGYVIRWSAIDSTGAAVTGVVVSGVSVYGSTLGSGFGSGSGPVGPFMLVPGPNA